MASHRSDHMLRGLLRASHVSTFEDLPALVAEHAERQGLHQATIFVSDLQKMVLREATGRGRDAGRGGTQLDIDTTSAGRAYTSGEISSFSEKGYDRHWLPLLDGTERLGVLRVDSRPQPTGQTMEAMKDLASLVGLLLVAKRANSDSYARLIRVNAMTVSAEMQWTLMPPRTFANSHVTIAAQMEPAYATAGDAFDYALAANIAHLAIFDAMGHDTPAGLTANLAMATCRNRRRQGASLDHTCAAIEKMISEHFMDSRYATAVLADLDMITGLLTWVNCGHPQPVLIRGGRRTTHLECPPAPPLGTGFDLPISVCRKQLQPGDRLLLYTDGVTEARSAAGTQFGLDRFIDALIRHQTDDLSVPETLRRLIHAVLHHHEGNLSDDATVLLCEWNGPPSPRGRGAA
ncbi:PP2C family protein-serine/threonine phosphatase [Streptomyces sp. NPDC051776]|uniref:PP2C family protein-serine/threonine phosphatase n=1 Tax=Streptomyces sp. NPDC051776 TaxID=3155414 RepID=UPI0034278019